MSQNAENTENNKTVQSNNKTVAKNEQKKKKSFDIGAEMEKLKIVN